MGITGKKTPAQPLHKINQEVVVPLHCRSFAAVHSSHTDTHSHVCTRSVWALNFNPIGWWAEYGGSKRANNPVMGIGPTAVVLWASRSVLRLLLSFAYELGGFHPARWGFLQPEWKQHFSISIRVPDGRPEYTCGPFFFNSLMLPEFRVTIARCTDKRDKQQMKRRLSMLFPPFFVIIIFRLTVL